MGTVVSAQSQVVAGTNYRVTLNIGLHENVVIGYFIGLPANDAEQKPTNLQVIDLGIGGVDSPTSTASEDNSLTVGSYEDVTDLSEVKSTVFGIDANIRSLLSDEGLSIGDSDTISVVSAQSQVVEGTNYRVTLNVGNYRNVVIQYFVGLNADVPSDYKVIDLGSTTTSTTLQTSETTAVVKAVGEDSETSGMSNTVMFIIIAAVIAMAVFVGVAVIAMCLRRRKVKTPQGNGLYAELSKNGDTFENMV